MITSISEFKKFLNENNISISDFAKYIIDNNTIEDNFNEALNTDDEDDVNLSKELKDKLYIGDFH